MPISISMGLSNHSGVQVTWTPTAQRLDFSGWYDSYVGIEGDSMSLGEFFAALGITERDCKRAFSDKGE